MKLSAMQLWDDDCLKLTRTDLAPSNIAILRSSEAMLEQMAEDSNKLKMDK